MSDAKWLEGYTGQSVDQLLALEDSHRIDSLVVAIEQALDQKTARDGDGSLSAEERVVLAVEALEREVNNGGYSQFFINSSAEYTAIIVDSLRRIGCNATADITQSAIDALEVEELSVETIDAAMVDDDPARDAALAECDSKYFESSEDIAGRLFEFIRTNKSAYSLP